MNKVVFLDNLKLCFLHILVYIIKRRQFREKHRRNQIQELCEVTLPLYNKAVLLPQDLTLIIKSVYARKYFCRVSEPKVYLQDTITTVPLLAFGSVTPPAICGFQDTNSLNVCNLFTPRNLFFSSSDISNLDTDLLRNSNVVERMKLKNSYNKTNEKH